MVQDISLHKIFPWPFSFYPWALELIIKTKRHKDMAPQMRIIGINLLRFPRNAVTLMSEPLLWWRSSLKCLRWCGFIHLCIKVFVENERCWKLMLEVILQVPSWTVHPGTCTEKTLATGINISFHWPLVPEGKTDFLSTLL